MTLFYPPSSPNVHSAGTLGLWWQAVAHHCTVQHLAKQLNRCSWCPPWFIGLGGKLGKSSGRFRKKILPPVPGSSSLQLGDHWKNQDHYFTIQVVGMSEAIFPKQHPGSDMTWGWTLVWYSRWKIAHLVRWFFHRWGRTGDVHLLCLITEGQVLIFFGLWYFPKSW